MVQPILDPNDADHRLVWPKDVLEAEIGRRLRIAGTAHGRQRGAVWSEAVARLLRSAFEGPGLAEEFEAQGGFRAYGDPLADTQVDWLRRLFGEIDHALAPTVARPYWSRRRGAQPAVLDQHGVTERFVELVLRLHDRQGLWAEAFGVDCPDGVGDPATEPRRQIEDLLGREIGEGIDWPLSKPVAADWSVDDLFDLIEVFHDLASWPGTWWGHDYGGCIGHPGDFSRACGRGLYRHEVNALFARSDLGVRLAGAGEDEGRIVQHDGEALAEAVDDALRSAPASHRDEVKHAVALFRQRDRDVAMMRSAIVALAGVLEAHRDRLKEELLTSDEGALFEIANRFDLRHRKADQRNDYDPAFLEWIFHWYLSTISLVVKLQAKEQDVSPLESGYPWGEEPF